MVLFIREIRKYNSNKVEQIWINIKQKKAL